MGFGAIITLGEQNKLLQDKLLNRITEVRVEQSLDDPTRYAIRLDDDICGGEFEVMDAPEIQPGAMMAIAVKVGGEIKCLVRGPITEVHSFFMLGGPGSSCDIWGEDRRVELDREWVQRRWSGLASDAARTLLEPKFRTKIQPTTIMYGSVRSKAQEVFETLNQRSTDGYFIACIARDNNLHFWLEYDCRAAGDSLIIEETANLKSSPPRDDSKTAASADIPVKLVPTTELKLRVNVGSGNCPNTTVFNSTSDAELPNRFRGASIDNRSVENHPTEVLDPQPLIVKGGERPGSEKKRDVCLAVAGNPEELHIKAQSALTEAGWFLHAAASTTVHRLGGVLLPHDIIEVEGLGSRHDGPYQVQSVTHVINAADHFMDIELRRNAVGKK